MSVNCLIIAVVDDASVSGVRDGNASSASLATSKMASIVVGLASVTCAAICGCMPLMMAKSRILSSADISFASFLICMI